MNVKNELEKLNFHDSTFRGIHILFSDGSKRSCLLDINYYNWEGNRSSNDNFHWDWKRIHLRFDYLVHIEYSTPDILNRAQDIADITLDHKLRDYHKKWSQFKKRAPRGNYPLFKDNEETLSLKFNLNNFERFKRGYLWIVGSGISLEWLDKDVLDGQTHIPIGNSGK